MDDSRRSGDWTLEAYMAYQSAADQATRSAIDHLRELLAQRFDFLDRAVEIQATEYERRLQLLNHENARIVEAASRSVSVERFDGFVKAQDLHNKQTAEFMSNYSGQARGMSLTIAYIVTATSVLFGLIGTGLAIAVYFGGA